MYQFVDNLFLIVLLKGLYLNLFLFSQKIQKRTCKKSAQNSSGHFRL